MTKVSLLNVQVGADEHDVTPIQLGPVEGYRNILIELSRLTSGADLDMEFRPNGRS